MSLILIIIVLVPVRGPGHGVRQSAICSVSTYKPQLSRLFVWIGPLRSLTGKGRYTGISSTPWPQISPTAACGAGSSADLPGVGESA